MDIRERRIESEGDFDINNRKGKTRNNSQKMGITPKVTEVIPTVININYKPKKTKRIDHNNAS